MKIYSFYKRFKRAFIIRLYSRCQLRAQFLLITIALLSQSTVIAQVVSLPKGNLKLEYVLQEIRKQTGYNYFADSQLLSTAQPVVITEVKLSLQKLLEQSFENQNLNYSIDDKLIIVKAAPTDKSMTTRVNTRQQRQLSGTILDEDGELPLANASIHITGTNLITQTDDKGRFSIQIPSTAQSFEVSYIGYLSKTVVITEKSEKLVIRLNVLKHAIAEVVVRTGVYRRPVENFTGSARTITAEELRRVAPNNLLAAISILEPSFMLPENINFGSNPNVMPDMELRGQNNFADPNALTSNSNASLRNVFGDKPNAPLFVLDGFQVSLQRIFDLDMNRVERITVLKDAAATSIYGSRANNGVIVIDTRQPQEGKLRLSYRGGVSLTTPDLTSYDLLNASEKLAFEKKVGYYVSADPDRTDIQFTRDQEYNERLKDVIRGVDTYWLSQPLNSAVGNNQALYLEGGDNVMRYGINLNSLKEQGVMIGSKRDRMSGGVTLTYRNGNLLFSNDLGVNKVKGVNSPYGSFSEYSRLNQYWSPYDEEGNYAVFLGKPRRGILGVTQVNYGNPLYNANLPQKDFNDQIGFTNNFRFEWSVKEWLRLVGALGYSSNKTSFDKYVSSKHTQFRNVPLTERGSYSKMSGENSLIDASLGVDIRKNWAKHLVFFTGNFNINEGKENEYITNAIGFPNERVAELIFANRYDSLSVKPLGSFGIRRMVSSRLNSNYTYDNRYLLDLSISADASSQFGVDRNLAPFWSAGLGWNMHRESFIEIIPLINFLKLRGSLGTTGEQNFPPYMALSTYSYYNDQYYLDQLSVYQMGFGNPTLGWQKSLKRSVGVDATLWRNRMSLSLDYYNNSTKDLILDITTPPSMGFNYYKENVGSLKNEGWQASMNLTLLQRPVKDFYWRVGVSAFSNKNTISKISNSLQKINDGYDLDDQNPNSPSRKTPKHYYKEGASLTALYAVRSMGIDPSNGQELFIDKDGTLTYVWDSKDKVVVGDTRPRLSGTLSTGLDYKGFGINIYMSYRLGAHLYNQTLLNRVENVDITYNVDRRVMTDTWQQPGDVKKFKGILGSDDGRIVVEPTLATTRFVQKEYLLDISRVSFSYLFPDRLKWLRNSRLSNTRLELYMANPLQFSSIQRERGLDYPFARTYTFNISTSIF